MRQRGRKPEDEQELNAIRRARIHILQPLHDALEHWPEVSALSYEATDIDDHLRRLRALLDIDETQAIAIADMQIRRLSVEQRARIAEELREVKAEISD